MRKVVGARLENMLILEEIRGDGSKENPIRVATTYWTMDGKLIADNEKEPCNACKARLETLNGFKNSNAYEAWLKGLADS